MGHSGARGVILAVLVRVLVGAGAWCWADEPGPELAERPLPECYFVVHKGTALLGADGSEIERLDAITSAAGAISPDGRWVAFSRSRPIDRPDGGSRSELVIQSRAQPKEHRSVPMDFGTTGSSFLPFWSTDSRRVLICEQGLNLEGSRRTSFRLYDAGSKSLSPVNLPDRWWPNDWSADGKRVLTSLADRSTVRVAWVNIDRSGEPQYVTPDDVFAYGARLSPDNRRILCMVGPRDAGDGPRKPRLEVIDLATGSRTVVDRPGHTHGYCWSSDGRRVAYTWQGPLISAKDNRVRRTYLVTINADGSDRRTVTTRTYTIPEKASVPLDVIIFFRVVGWWRPAGTIVPG